MNNGLAALLAIVSGIITLAIISVLVSKGAQTGQVATSVGGALSKVIGAAVAPVTGGSAGGDSASSFLQQASTGVGGAILSQI